MSDDVWSGEDLEAFDAFGDEESDEGYFDSDGEAYGEDSEARSPARRRRRAKARQARLAQRKLQRLQAARAARRKSGRPRSPGAIVAGTKAELEKVDLKTTVMADDLERKGAAGARRTDGLEYFALGSTIVNQFQNTFNLIKNPFGKAALSFAPLVLLKPAKKGSGAGALVRNPVALGAAAVAAIAVAGDLNSRRGAVRRIEVLGVPTLNLYRPNATFIADVLDGQGKPVPGKVPTWASSDPTIAAIDANGNVTTHTGTAVNIGTVFITATVDGVVGRALLTVDF